MGDKLRDFLIRLANDRTLIKLFDDVADVLDRSGLNANEQAAILSRDLERVLRLLGDEDRDLVQMIRTWFKPSSMA
jgi:hypothetical protein